MPYVATGRPQGKPSTRPLEQSPENAPTSVAPVVQLGTVGAAVWAHLWETTTHLREGDALVVSMMCATLDEIAAIRDGLASGSITPTYTTTTGRVYAHPAIGQLRTAETKVTAWCAMLGLSPSDRARLGIREHAPNSISAFREKWDTRSVEALGKASEEPPVLTLANAGRCKA